MEQRKIKTVVVEQEESLHVEEPNNAIEIPKVHSPNQHNLPPQTSNMVATTLLFPLQSLKVLWHQHSRIPPFLVFFFTSTTNSTFPLQTVFNAGLYILEERENQSYCYSIPRGCLGEGQGFDFCLSFCFCFCLSHSQLL